jgi:hypothetical protein
VFDVAGDEDATTGESADGDSRLAGDGGGYVAGLEGLGEVHVDEGAGAGF